MIRNTISRLDNLWKHTKMNSMKKKILLFPLYLIYMFLNKTWLGAMTIMFISVLAPIGILSLCSSDFRGFMNSTPADPEIGQAIGIIGGVLCIILMPIPFGLIFMGLNKLEKLLQTVYPEKMLSFPNSLHF